jgi:RNA polymerase sigma-70 factor, ECF subfamily
MGDSDLTQLLEEWRAGSLSAQERVIEATYGELRSLAAAQFRHEFPGHTLQPTALVHEALLRLLGDRPSWENRRHFFGAAAQAMRRVLVDHARRKRAAKRGGEAEHANLPENVALPQLAAVDVIGLDEALNRLDALDPIQVRIVELRFFAGLSIEETAEALDLHPSGVNREWTAARAWLRKELASSLPNAIRP